MSEYIAPAGLMPEGFREMPNNVDAEQALLGAILVNNEAFHQVDGIVSAEHFYEPVHRQIFGVFAKMCRAGQLVNHVTAQAAFKDHPALAALGGGRKYLAGMAMAAETILNAPDYARLIRDLACRRAVITFAQDAATNAFDLAADNKDWSEISGQLREQLDGLSSGMVDDRVLTGAQVIERLAKKLDGGVKPIPTGIERLDRSFGGGLRKGCLYGFEGAAKRFKSGTAAAIFEGVVKSGHRAMFLTLEMSAEDIVQRLVGGHAGISYLQMEDERFKAENIRRAYQYQNSMGGFEDALFMHIPGASYSEVMAYCARAVTEHRCDVLIIDYWQRIQGQDENKTEAANLEKIANHLADFAAKHGPSIVMASQLNDNEQSLNSRGLQRACTWRGKIHKVEMPTNDPDRTEAGLWIEISENRYGPGGHIGDDTAPAFRIATGPVLRDWAE